jgi:hypothetical protein
MNLPRFSETNYIKRKNMELEMKNMELEMKNNNNNLSDEIVKNIIKNIVENKINKNQINKNQIIYYVNRYIMLLKPLNITGSYSLNEIQKQVIDKLENYDRMGGKNKRTKKYKKKTKGRKSMKSRKNKKSI